MQAYFFNIFEKTQAQRNSTAQKTQGFFRLKLNEPVVKVVKGISKNIKIFSILAKKQVLNKCKVVRSAQKKSSCTSFQQKWLSFLKSGLPTYKTQGVRKNNSVPMRKNSSFLASKLNEPVVINYTCYH